CCSATHPNDPVSRVRLEFSNLVAGSVGCWQTCRVDGAGRPSSKDLAGAWWTFQRLAQGSRDDRKQVSGGEPGDGCAGWEAARDLIDSGATDALELVVALIEQAADRDGVAIVGAGPLEDLIHQHGTALVADIERLARQHPGFRAALRSVWMAPALLE